MKGYDWLADAVRGRATGRLGRDLYGYVTKGGTYMIGSAPTWNDDGRPHDLVAVLPVPLEGSRVLVLRPTVNPDLVDALRVALDTEAVTS